MQLGSIALLSAAVVGFPSAARASYYEPETQLTSASIRQVGSFYWHANYAAAYQQARRERRLLFILFRDDDQSQAADHYEDAVLSDPELRESLQTVVRVTVSTETTIPDENGQSNRRLLDHPAFRHQQGRQGIAIIDLTDPESPFYGKVVSSHVFSPGKHYTLRATRTVLGLPEGSITQRALVYALRMHPESPRSVYADVSRVLLEQANSHSRSMAQWRQVGHQNWGSRSQQISAQLGGNSGLGEVAAQVHGSTLIDAAKNCVNAWRNSPGHWALISGPAALFGYDLVKAPDGSWYGAGIFAY